MTPLQQYIKQTLSSKRRKLSTKQRKARVPRPPRRLYPWAIERKMYRLVSAHLSPLRRAVERYLKENGEGLLRGDSLKTDALPGPGFHQFIQTIKGWVGMYFPEEGMPSALLMGLDDIADDMEVFNEAEWMKAALALSGSELALSAEWWPIMKQGWVNSNYTLIKSVAERYVADVNRVVERAVTNGWAARDLKEEIDRMGLGLEDYQSKRLARDQIGKMNSNISQAQSQEAGFETYIWQTAGDDRVVGTPGGKYPDGNDTHGDHYVMDGALCRWDDPEVCSWDDGQTWEDRPAGAPLTHPGIEIQCRCVAVVDIKSVVKTVDKDLEEEEADEPND